jgi:hypothetical protein
VNVPRDLPIPCHHHHLGIRFMSVRDKHRLYPISDTASSVLHLHYTIIPYQYHVSYNPAHATTLPIHSFGNPLCTSRFTIRESSASCTSTVHAGFGIIDKAEITYGYHAASKISNTSRPSGYTAIAQKFQSTNNTASLPPAYPPPSSASPLSRPYSSYLPSFPSSSAYTHR